MAIVPEGWYLFPLVGGFVKIRGTLAGLVLEELGEMGEISKAKFVGDFLYGFIGIQEQSFGFRHDAFVDHL